MKITSIKFAWPAIVFVCAIAVFSCVHHPQEGSGSGTVKIEETGILLTGAPISVPDAKALEKILKQHDRSLYKIDVYNDGKVTKTLGRLDQSLLKEVTVAKVAEKAKRPDFSGWALQIGTTTGSTTGSSTHPTPHREVSAEEKELLRQVKPILEKYTHN